jgi:hypothetical protein
VIAVIRLEKAVFADGLIFIANLAVKAFEAYSTIWNGVCTVEFFIVFEFYYEIFPNLLRANCLYYEIGLVALWIFRLALKAKVLENLFKNNCTLEEFLEVFLPEFYEIGVHIVEELFGRKTRDMRVVLLNCFVELIELAVSLLYLDVLVLRLDHKIIINFVVYFFIAGDT